MIDNRPLDESNRTLLIVGAGGLGQIVAEIAQMSGRYTKIAFLDDNPAPEKMRLFHIVGGLDEAHKFVNQYALAIPAIGDNSVRLKVLNQLIGWGFTIPSMVHPSAFVSQSAQIGVGCIIRGHAAISFEVQLGKGCLINMGAMIDHGCVLGEGTHIPMGCIVRNQVILPPLSNFEPNAVIQ